MDAFIGEIRPFAFNFTPSGWIVCKGQLLSIAQYTALFSILGTQYGGNGTSTFALPNLQSAVLNGSGQLQGGSNYVVGQVGGTAKVTLVNNEMPAHNHTFNGATATDPAGAVNVPVANTYLSNPNAGGIGRGFAPSTGTPLVNLNIATIGPSGGSQPHDNMMPYLGINYCICVNGEFPSRN